MAQLQEQPTAAFAPALRCVLQHFYELRFPGDRIGPDNNKRLAHLTSLHRLARRQGRDGLRGVILASVHGEARMDAEELPVGAALFPDIVPVSFVLQKLRGDAIEFRLSAIFASVFYPSGPLSLEIAEQFIVGSGNRLILQAMKEVLELRASSGSGGKCSKCGVRGLRNQALLQSLDWEPHRA